MKEVTIYSTAYCPYCVRAKALFSELGAAFKEVDLSEDAEKRAELSAQTGWMTVPMIFIGDEFIGGYDEVSALHAKNLLIPKLAD